MSKKYIFLSIKILTFFLVIYLFFKFINQKDLFSTITKISIKNVILIYLLYLSLPIAHALRWFIIVKNFSKIKFIELLKNLITGYSFSLILSSTLAIDASKFIKIKKEVGYKNSLLLVSIDKFFALAFKLVFLSIFIISYLYFYTQIEFDYILLSIFFTLVLILFFSKIDKIIFVLCKKFLLKKSLKNIKFIFKNIKKNIIQLIFVNTVSQLINVTLYFLIFLSLGSYLQYSILLIFTPFAELIGQFSFLIFGMKEIGSIFLLNFFNIEKELALAVALIYLFIEYLVVISLYILLNIKKFNILKNK